MPRIAAAVDEAKKSYRTILTLQIAEGQRELERRATGLLLSGLSAGLDVGFSVLFMSVMLTRLHGVLPEPLVDLMVAPMYAVGFIFVILGRSELFTEHTTTAMFPVLDGRASLWQLLRLWGLVYLGNVFGATLFARLITVVGPALGVVEPWAFGELGNPLVHHSWWVILLSAIMAGWLMGLLSWLVAAGRDTISQVVLVALVTSVIGLGHLHHSIAGTAEVMAALFAGQGMGMSDVGHFLLWTTLGNAVGGTFFVALVKYSHATRSREEPEVGMVEMAPSPAPAAGSLHQK